MQLSLIAALDLNRVIGYRNQLPWHLPADLRHFKQLTLGKPVLMGRKTFESIGKPLPQRQNIVITRDNHWRAEGCAIAHSLSAGINLATDAKEVMIIGGQTLFTESMPLADRLYLTVIQHQFTGDTFFPAWNPEEWIEIQREDFPADEQNLYAYRFLELVRARQGTLNF